MNTYWSMVYTMWALIAHYETEIIITKRLYETFMLAYTDHYNRIDRFKENE